MAHVVVIGAGIGGIAAAARLARAGHRVTVLEKTARLGGRASLIREEGYTFDTGPSLFLMPATYAQTYSDLGERMADHLDLVQIDPTYRLRFHDGSILDLGNDMAAMHRQLEEMEPGAFGALLRFLEQGYRRYTGSMQRFLNRNFASLGEYLAPSNLPLLVQLRPLSKHYDDVSRHFRDARLRAAFSFQNMYLGLSPFDAPATYSLLQYTEMVEGVWYPREGMYAVVESLARIAEGLGVELVTGATVRRIDTEPDRATGAELDSGERVEADVVVANADLPYVYDELLPHETRPRRLGRMRYTSSAFMFYWGLRGERSTDLLHHNVFLSDHVYRESFDAIFRQQRLPDEPSFYIHAPVRTVPGFAPAGADALMVLVPTGHMTPGSDQDWGVMQARARRAVLNRLSAAGLGDVEGRIVFERTLTPPDFCRRWNLSRGAAFGLSHEVTQVGYFRPHNRHARYGNLYFVGASTHPGTGVPLVLLSAKLVSERILHEQGSRP